MNLSTTYYKVWIKMFSVHRRYIDFIIIHTVSGIHAYIHVSYIIIGEIQACQCIPCTIYAANLFAQFVSELLAPLL